MSKKEITIIVTDSGFGGMSVAAEICKIIKKQKRYKEAKVIFFDSFPKGSKGYHSLRNLKQRVNKFDSALDNMISYKPNVIVIACNTLSAIYKYTKFFKKKIVPVVGIIDIGVELILKKNKGVIIFATPITIEQGTHKKILIKNGFKKDKIIEQPCSGLANAISKGDKKEIKLLIDKYVKESVRKLKGKSVVASLNCTHFGYYANSFKDSFSKEGFNVDVINPNAALGGCLFEEINPNRNVSTKLEIDIVLFKRISRNAASPLILYLSKISPDFAIKLKETLR